MKKVSVIIPTYNRLSIFKKCLQSILEQTYNTENYEIVIVDDCSSDDTNSYCENIIKRYSNIKYIRNESNQGRVITRNNGILASTGEILIYLDNDNVVSSEFINAHYNMHQSFGHKHIAVLGNICYDPVELKKSNFGRFIQSRAIGYRSRRDMKGIDLNNLNPKFFAGGNSSVRKEDAVKIGLFDGDFKRYGGEDESFGYSLNQHGIRLVYAEDAKSVHYDNNIGPSYWKIKFIETGRYGIKVIMNKNSEYITKTNVKYIMPVSFKDDNIKDIIVKISLKIIMSKIFIKLLEFYAFKTDKFSVFYLPLIFRILTASWVRKGFVNAHDIELVKY